MKTNPNLSRLLADLRLIGGALHVLPFIEENAIVIDTDSTLFSVYYNQSAFVKRAVEATKFYGFEIYNTDIRLGRVQINLLEPIKKEEVAPLPIKEVKPTLSQEEVVEIRKTKLVAQKLSEQQQAEREEQEDSVNTITLTIKQLKSIAVRANSVKPKFISHWIHEEIIKLKEKEQQSWK